MRKPTITDDGITVDQTGTVLDPHVCKSEMIVFRPPDVYGSGIPVDLFIDGLCCGQLFNGQQLEIPVPEGNHTIYARLHNSVRSRIHAFFASENVTLSTVRIISRRCLFYQGPAVLLSLAP